MADIIAHCARRIDFALQSRFRLSRVLRVPAQGGPSHVFTAEDWGRERRARTAPARAGEDRYGSDAAYRRYLEAIHDSKIRAVLSLMEAFDFTRHARILELGCGDMPQAYTVVSRAPAVAYTATDYDPLVIGRCERVPMLGAIRKGVLDASGSLDALALHDLVTSWSLEFSLDDAALTRLFAACRTHAKPYLLCTHAAIGPIGYLASALAARGREGGATRPLGWLRSVAELERLARAGGMRLEWKAYHVNHAALFFTP